MAEPKWKAAVSDIGAVVGGQHDNPFQILGLHKSGSNFVARAFVPGAERVTVRTLAGKMLGELERRDAAGFFEGLVKTDSFQTLRLDCSNSGGRWSVVDAYTCGPVLGPMDDYYIGEGNHLRLSDKLGAHPVSHAGVEGVHFAVWAPNARRVSVIGDFNEWDGRRHVMRKRLDIGVWEIFVPGATVGQGYKFELIGKDGNLMPLKSDPFGFSAELRPNTASKVASLDGFSGDLRCRSMKFMQVPGARLRVTGF
jgi:1,4-alpha-glucan branching enzyme